MKTLLSFAFAALMTSAAQAQVTIRSGEHATFSRLVFTAPPGTDWSIDREGQNAIVRLTDTAQNFDTSNIFSRIPRTRLSNAIDTGRGRLRLEMDCDCQINGFQLNNRVFVVDIQDPLEPIDTNSLETARQQTQADEPEAVSLPVFSLDRPGTGAVPPLGFPQADISVRSNSNTNTSQNPDLDISDVRVRLIEEVGKAASQGLLQANRPSQLQPARSDAEASLDTTNERTTEPATPRDVLSSQAITNMQVQSSSNLPLSDAVTQVFGGREMAGCLSDEELDISAWSPTSNMQSSVGELRRKLYGEFDRLDPSAALKLAKLYIHLGFGAEALAILSLNESATPETTILVEIAETLEFGSARFPEALTAQHQCDSAAALWAVATDPSLESTTEFNSQALLRSFDALPAHLRTYLGPRLSQKLRTAGYHDEAEAIIRIVGRGSKTKDSAVEMEIAQLEIAKGNIEKGEGGLESVIQDNAPLSPNALIDIIDLKISEKKGIDSELATLAAAYAFEFRDSRLGVALQRAHVLALMDSGQFAAATETLDELEGELLPKKQKETRSIVMSGITKKASDAQFIEIVLPLLNMGELSVSQSVENEIAERLIILKIPEFANALLSEGATGGAGRERRILRSQLAHLEGRSRNAVAHLLGVEGEDVDELRAKYLMEMGEYSRARLIYDKLGRRSDAQKMAILERDMRYLSSVDDEQLSPFANSVLERNTSDAGIAGIQASLSFLSESSATRDQVQEFLAQFEVDVAPETGLRR